MTRKARTTSPGRTLVPSDFAVRLRKAATSADGTIDAAKLRRLAMRNGVWDERYAKLSNGLARMSIGNTSAPARESSPIKSNRDAQRPWGFDDAAARRAAARDPALARERSTRMATSGKESRIRFSEFVNHPQ